ncbi:GCN5-related N-acetyltransferase [Syntrophobotulus glycolicus DSM 8271]|uniref:GCN5-related N-acetyltransferase n=1 Tax=Syntrophobotulus glycolicus (strain DSM 8271 / FlGlyR) TaxID=645991 RepID=F0T1Y0_SYNGF|nr:N-acetyltransferase [Syntrophobotulus glycolicus]ADY55244.1 GCN5-related N-acetyltransferase [Syntrophobotulus glycolicus DSM 8271]
MEETKSNHKGNKHVRKIKLRLEQPADYRKVEELTREAFWNHYVPGCNEHYLLHIMRDCGAFIRELDTVAEIDGEIVGNIVYTKGKILGDDGISREVLSFGPVSVLPALKAAGIGSALIEYTLARAKESGHGAVLIYGDPAYYQRFGFISAETFGIGTADNMYAQPLQALELREGTLRGCKGRFFEDAVYDIDEEAAAEFDKTFPDKELQDDLPSQERFRCLLGLRRPRGAGGGKE